MDGDGTSSAKRQKTDHAARRAMDLGKFLRAPLRVVDRLSLSSAGRKPPRAPAAASASPSTRNRGSVPAPRPGNCTWPEGRLPVELFDVIASSLPRRAIQNMRLVNHEFEDKLAGWYFRNVVAAFRPDIYGYLSEDFDHVIDVSKAARRKDQSVIKNGLRVFQQFGRRIKAFALSLELNEADLVDPPAKLSQEVVKTPWGLYRWPVENYTRYSNLENLEDTADETQRMTQAFGKLTKLNELGLSCDAGLGFLLPPAAHKTQSRVFESSRYDPEPVSEHVHAARETDPGRSARYTNLKRMVLKAGFAESETQSAIKLLLECEGRTPGWVDGAVAAANEDAGAAGTLIAGSASNSQAQPPAGQYGGDLGGGRKTLEPKNLTAPQMEMLLEMKWALDALTQSYVISVVDNEDIFSKVTVLCLARIPSSLLPTLAREDLWGTLKAIETFRLGVVPDWRSFTKSSDGVISEEKVSPLEAFPHVFELLKTHVAPLGRLKQLHFEWLCGGEAGDGLGQRNRYILPAPFTAAAGRMADTDAAASNSGLLLLPQIQQLSLKNCWFTPHVFIRVVDQMVKSSLTELQLESVSLTGPPTTVPRDLILARRGMDFSHWPWPMCTGPVTPGQMFNHTPAAANANNANAVPPPAGGWLGQPLPLTLHTHLAAVQAAAQLNPQQAFAQLLAAPIPVLMTTAAQGVAPANINALNLQVAAHSSIAGPHTTAGPAASAAAGVPPPDISAGTFAPFAVMQPSVSTVFGLDGLLPFPRFLAWAHVINELTPGPSILAQYEGVASAQQKEEFQDRLDKKLDEIGLRRGGAKKRLRKLSFKSCGYVLVDHVNLDNWQMLPNRAVRANFVDDICEQLMQLDKVVMQSYDPLLARIVDYIPVAEKHILYNLFGLSIPGYDSRYDSNQVDPGQYRDGFILHGVGRFHGVIERDPRSAAWGRG